MAFLRAFALVLVFVACGCADKTTVKTSDVIQVEEFRKSRSIAVTKVVFKVPRGTVVGQLRSGLTCFPQRAHTWGAGRRETSTQEYHAVINDELRNAGYTVKGDPTELFGHDESSAELAIGAVLRNVSFDSCHPRGAFLMIDTSRGKASATVNVEWHIYSYLEHKVVLRASTTGEATKEYSGGHADDVIFLAFGSAAQELLARKDFHELLMKGQPAGPEPSPEDQTDEGVMFGAKIGASAQPAPQSESPEPPAQQSAAPVQQSATPATQLTVPLKNGETRKLDQVKDSVVVLQMGGHGSGVLVGDQGLILTNAHVTSGLPRMRVLFTDGTKAQARVLAEHKNQDIAVLQLDAPRGMGLPIRLEDVSTGTEVFAVGAPRGTEMIGTVTRGIVSGYRFRKSDHTRWLQSDVAVNKGNSGGALVDGQGRLVGLTSFMYRSDSVGLNFFVPIAEGLRVLNIQTK